MLLKIAGVSAVLAMIICLSACGGQKNEKVSIAMITTEKSMLNDGTYNQSAYEGIQKYAEGRDVVYKVYPPESMSEEDYLKAIDEAARDGVELCVTPGFNFETTIFNAQRMHPGVHFVLIDGVPNNGRTDEAREEKIAENTYSILFAEEQAGFLAGYAIVKDGFRNLGFLGGREFPAVVGYGYGFVQGAEYAAKELGLNPGEVTVKYEYAGTYEPSPEVQAKAASWYNDGIEVIFACGGGMGISVIQASKVLANKWVIGVDTDQSGDSETVITSAMKMIANSVNRAIEAHFDNSFPGGQKQYLGADKDGVGLAMDTSRFKSFSKAGYEKIYNMIAEDQNGIASSIVKDNGIEVKELPCEYVKVN